MTNRMKVLVSKSEARRLSFSKESILVKVKKLEEKGSRTAEENAQLEKLKNIIADIESVVVS